MKLNILNKINSPKDLKKLNKEELLTLAGEIREIIINKVSQTGGHFGPNLGMVEATIALHYVFNSPVDKIVYDVSHQSYPHKILTGRKHAFLNPNEYNSITGYTSQLESEHDFFRIGHTSTSISLACGLAKARDVKGSKENIIAVIGDGSLSGGEAYEGLNNASASGSFSLTNHFSSHLSPPVSLDHNSDYVFPLLSLFNYIWNKIQSLF